MNTEVNLRLLAVFFGGLFWAAPLHATPSHRGGSPVTREAPAESESCHLPQTHHGFAVDTDGGKKDGTKEQQSGQAFQNTLGKIDPDHVFGAVQVNNEGLHGGDLICYTINGRTVCGIVFDNGFKEGSPRGVAKNGSNKPAEATPALHKALGAKTANGSQSDLGSANVITQGVQLSEADKKQIKDALEVARNTDNYARVNRLIQEKAQQSNCGIKGIDPNLAGSPRGSSGNI